MSASMRGAKEQNTSEKKDLRRFFRRIASFILTFCLMFTLWIIFSGVFEPFFLGMGIISSILVAAMYHEFLFPHPRLNYLKFVLVFSAYVFWLLWQVFKANLHLMKIIFHPRMMDLIDPQIIAFRTPLRNTLSLTTMANSITLTPGTVTISVNSAGLFKVHSIDKASAKALKGQMDKKINKIFGE
ncbi:MAG: Na+/H+ antiporter subunit E [Thermodesulfobacteriota bacterium]